MRNTSKFFTFSLKLNLKSKILYHWRVVSMGARGGGVSWNPKIFRGMHLEMKYWIMSTMAPMKFFELLYIGTYDLKFPTHPLYPMVGTILNTPKNWHVFTGLIFKVWEKSGIQIHIFNPCFMILVEIWSNFLVQNTFLSFLSSIHWYQERNKDFNLFRCKMIFGPNIINWAFTHRFYSKLKWILPSWIDSYSKAILLF